MNTITQKICTALLVSLLATCSTSPSYADQENVLTAIANTGNNASATPHCVVGLGSLSNTRRTTASLCGFFVRSIQSRPRYDGLDGDTFGCAGSCVPVCQPCSVCHPKLGSLSDGFITHTQEVNHD